MKKSLIALTLAALPVAAMADVTLYGQVKAGVEVSRVKSKNNGVTEKSKTATEIADFGSRIGFKGHEHLNGNLNAIWQVEQNTSVAGTDSGWGTRESFIGLEGGFGKVRAGKLNTALKDSSDSIDPWESSDANADVLQLGKMKRVDSRKVSVRYDSPVFAGFSASAQYQPRDNANPSDKYTHDVKSRDSYDLGLNYENSGFFGRYAGSFAKHAVLDGDYLNKFNSNTTLSADTYKDHQVHRLAAGYDANNVLVSVAGQYEGFKADQANAKKNERTEVAVTGGYRMGNVMPRVSYAHGFKAKEDGKKQANSQYNQVIVGADYDFSKRTSALVSAGWLKEGKGANKTQSTAGLVGLRHKF
ncbi:trimeric porin PorB [Neisseria mucosa]|uniref:trimeric porin PorB n=1 Tax=Neisseria mucosa TaxID=488 RepID=UPI00280A8D9B|nr:trimeric porin PorB [Neisseria mucosa]